MSAREYGRRNPDAISLCTAVADPGVVCAWTDPCLACGWIEAYLSQSIARCTRLATVTVHQLMGTPHEHNTALCQDHYNALVATIIKAGSRIPVAWTTVGFEQNS